MINNPQDKAEIQIDDNPPVVISGIIEIGNEFYDVDIFSPQFGLIDCFTPVIKYAVIHYTSGSDEINNHYRTGKWTTGTNGMPRFCVRDFIE
jgi:hypothetical protein